MRVSACLLHGSISVPSRRRHIWCPCAWPSFSRRGLSAVVSSLVKTCCPSPAGCGRRPVSLVLTPGQPALTLCSGQSSHPLPSHGQPC